MENLNDISSISENFKSSKSKTIPKNVFLREFSLIPNSVFYKFLLKLIFYFKKCFIINDHLRNRYEEWVHSYPRKSIKPPKKWHPILNEVDWSDQQTLKFIFCLESAYILLVTLILAKAGEEQKVPYFQLSVMIEEYFSHYPVESEFSLIKWGKIGIKIIENVRNTLGDHMIDFTQYMWWQSELIEFLEPSHASIKSINLNDALIEFCSELHNIISLITRLDLSTFTQDVFGDLYQNYFDKETKKTLGEFYTSTEIVDYILDYVNYQEHNDAILNENLIDPSCGTGSFLIEALKRYLKAAKLVESNIEKEYWSNTIRGIFNDYKIVGYDVNPFAIILAKMNFLFVMLPYLRSALIEDQNFKITCLPIFKIDALNEYSQKNNHTEAKSLNELKHIKKTKFNYVVGNPPYINIRKINKEHKKHYKDVYQTAKGLFDTYCLFIEKGVKLLRNEGKLGYLTSNQFLLTDYGKYLRKFLIKKNCYCIKHILDFRDSRVIESVTNYPCILVLEKNLNAVKVENNRVKVVRVIKPVKNIINKIKSELSHSEYYTKNYEIFDFPQSYLSDDLWILMPKQEKDIFDHILKKKEFLLGEITENIFVGTQTSLDRIYLVFIEQELGNGIVRIRNKSTEKANFEIEKPILRRILKGKDVTKWTVNWSHHWLVFPYYPKEKTKPISSIKLQSSYPKTWHYFSEHKNQIINREGGRMKDRSTWYAYIYPKNHDKFEQTKLICQLLSKKNRFALDIEGQYYFVAVGGNCITLNKKYKNLSNYKIILALLNSTVLEFYFKHISPVHNGGYYLFIKQLIKRFPIILTQLSTNQRNEIIKKVDKIFEIKKEMKNSRISDIRKKVKILESLEFCIDQIVYKIYNLNPTDIQIIQDFNRRY